MLVSQYLESLAFQVHEGKMPVESPVFDEKMTFVNDFEDVVRQRIVEYDTWYSGDSDALWNLYFYNANIEFFTEPYYWKNKRTYFWTRCVNENEFKMTHSGFARAVIDTTVAVLGTPVAKCRADDIVPWRVGEVLDEVGADGQVVKTAPVSAYTQATLDKILEENDFWSLYKGTQMPMTLVEGWGAYKITWDVKMYGADPVVFYYRAENVRIYKKGHRVFGMTFLDWFKGSDGNRYLLAETRVMTGVRHGTVRFDAFRSDPEGKNLMPVSPDCEYISKPVGWHDMPCLFAVPCVFFDDSLHGYAGRSVLEGKLDLLDDLDQALSMQSNVTRRSTPIELFNMDYVDRDKDGAPKFPKTFERKYVRVRGARSADGGMQGNEPVTVTQPNLNSDMYIADIEEKQRMIINGFLSPATLGLDVAKKDNADAQREKEKVTIFTCNTLSVIEGKILNSLFKQLLVAKEFLVTGKITTLDYDVTVQYSDFFGEPFSERFTVLSQGMANDAISPEMFVDKVYGNTLTDDKRDREIAYLTEKNKRQAPPQQEGNPMFGGDDPFGGDEEEGNPLEDMDGDLGGDE